MLLRFVTFWKCRRLLVTITRSQLRWPHNITYATPISEYWIILTYILSFTVSISYRAALVEFSLSSGVPCLARSFSVISENITIHHILQRTRFLSAIADIICLTKPFWRHLPLQLLNSVKTQNNGHYVVQGHSRSLISAPIESPYATSYV